MAQRTGQPVAVAQQEHLGQVDDCLLGNLVVEAAGWQSLGYRAHTLAPAEQELHEPPGVVRPGPDLQKIAC